jgi:hypothetical protein
VAHKLRFTEEAADQLKLLIARPKLHKRVLTTLGYLETNLRHPGLHTHKYSSLAGANGEEVFEAYAQNETPGAYRVFWHYGPDEIIEKKRVPMLTIVAITPHPDE